MAARVADPVPLRTRTMASRFLSGLRKRSKRSTRRIHGWVVRQWLTRTEPRTLEIIARVGGSLDQLQQTLTEMIARDGVAAATATAQRAAEHAVTLTRRPSAAGAIHVAMIRALASVDLREAVRFGDTQLPISPEPRSLHTLALHHKLNGDFAIAIELLDRIGLDPAVDDATLQSRTNLRFEAAMELELIALRSASAEGGDAAAIADRMLVGRNERELAMLCRMFARAATSSEDVRLRRLLLSRLDTLSSSALPTDALDSLASSYLRHGHVVKAKTVLDQASDTDEKIVLQRRVVDALLHLDARGFDYTPPGGTYEAEPGRVLYILHSSLPHHSSGYATRSHGLLNGIARYPWRASGVTRLGYPQDLGNFQKTPVESTSVVDRVTYHRLPRIGPLFNSLPKTDYLVDYAGALCEIARAERPQILHAAADCHNGLAANAAARALGIKSIYEVRGLWEVTRGSRDPDWMETEHFRLMTRLEAQAACDADAVVVITRALGEEMVRRGVPREKMTLVPNGVDIDRFVPRPRDEALARKLGLTDKRVIGYIGSIVDYEGLDLLLHAVHRLHQRGTRDLAVLIVGDGVVLESLKKLARSLGIANLVVFTGRVPHHEVEAHYSLVDIAPFPRKSLLVTEMVSPLKPLEAMAMNKAVVASDVEALAEMIVPGVNGVTFRKDNIDDLTDVLERLLDERQRPTSPRKWVTENRSWHALAGIVDGLYKQLTR